MNNILFLFSSLFYFTNSYSQIVYTDIADFTGTGLGKPNLRDTFNLDLDNDAVIDFKLIIWNPVFGTTPHYELKVINTNSASRIGIKYENQFIASMAHAKNSGDSIYPTLATWKSEAQATSFQIFLAYNGGPSQIGGEFLGAGDKYLPLKFTIGANAHYGWVRVNVDSMCHQFIVKDYAYNATPNQPVFAGQTTGLYESGLNDINFIVAHGQVKVTSTEHVLNGNFNMSLYSLSGKKILQTRGLSFATQSFVKGIYIVMLEYNNLFVTRKVLIQ